MDLAGTIVLVTGSNRGISRAIAERPVQVDLGSLASVEAAVAASDRGFEQPRGRARTGAPGS